MGDTISRGAHIKVTTLGLDDSPKEWTWWEVLFKGLKTLNPHREVKSVFIHIYLFCIIIFLWHIYFSVLALHYKKKIKIFFMCIINPKAPCE
jgi:hypothetical protein